ncbi:HAD family hydrolase [Gemelliphila palaticanis]|uniref:HAD family hydrolase n=1 Tax=Gemelliphila palaticanis TaxID=81950 RepID=A0ABX2T0J5_9BACL|nr:HAD family hydrolase [Gemella palaticanis]MBF0715953.1 HAD family hydrolase [Gemella palaticanis]NYS47883.1 HAD family hydrolase [Gemella palaticanis]
MHNIDAIIFDLDNTLYDFSSAWIYAHKKVFYNYNLDKYTTYEQFFETFKNYDKEILEEIKAGTLRVRDLRRVRIQRTMLDFGIVFDEVDAKEYYKNMFEYIIEYISKDDTLVDILKQLKQNKKLFILTNGIGKEQYRKLDKLEITNLFDKIYISTETDINKPDLRAFLQILAENNLEFKKTLMVGDSVHHDLAPARKLGLKTCHIKRNWHLSNVSTNNIINCDYKYDDVLEFLKNI